MAQSYHSVITSKELAAQVMERSNIHTSRPTHYWIGDVLGRVSADCAERDEPLLSALCVNAEGSVGKAYEGVVVAARGSQNGDSDDHAAIERLECYRHFGAEMPKGGGVRALTPRLSASRSRERRARAAEKMPPAVPDLPHRCSQHGRLRLLRLTLRQRYIPPCEPGSRGSSPCCCSGLIPGIAPGGSARLICSSWERADICWA